MDGIFPLICGVLDAPAPENIDGELPADRLNAETELQYRSSNDRHGSSEYSADESDQVEEQLKGLGYLE